MKLHRHINSDIELSHIETNWRIHFLICSKVQQLGPHLVQRYVFLRFFELASYDNPSVEAVLFKIHPQVSLMK